jgi:hypothetical protein
VKCTAHRTDGQACGNFAMHGQRVCRMHGGATRQARAAAALRLERAASELYLARVAAEWARADQIRQAEARVLLGLPEGATLSNGDWMAVGAIRATREEQAMAATQARHQEAMTALDELEAALLPSRGA